MERRDYSRAIRWLFDHDVAVSYIAAFFNKSESSIPVIAWRDRNGLVPRKTELAINNALRAGVDADLLLANPNTEPEMISEEPTKLEIDVERFAETFWSKVRDHSGTAELGRLLRRASHPGVENISLRRSRSRLYHLLAEMHLHEGRCKSSLIYALKAYREQESLYKITLSRDELFSIGKTCLLISHAFILGSEFRKALPWLNVSKKAFEATGPLVDPEHYRQLAVVQFMDNPDEARKNLSLAGKLLPIFKPQASRAEVRDIGERFLKFVTNDIDWGESFNLFEYAIGNWPQGDLHVASNMNWAVGKALCTDSREAQAAALKLLEKHGSLSKGYLHQETVTELLPMASSLPLRLRRQWIWFAFHYNASRNK